MTLIMQTFPCVYCRGSGRRGRGSFRQPCDGCYGVGRIPPSVKRVRDQHLARVLNDGGVEAVEREAEFPARRGDPAQ
jgi:hypothetical protein